jgi:hypothetical protein
VSEVAVLKVVSPAIDGPNVALVIRFEREGKERLARWLGDGDWRERDTLHRLFESADDPRDGTGAGPAPAASNGSSLFIDVRIVQRRAALLEGARVTVTCLRVL